MIKQKSGSIVCTASVAGLKAGASGHPYGASKAGVISLVQTTAYSLSGTGVRINAVCPGLIETGMTKPIFDNAKARGTDGKIGQLNPLEARRPAARTRRDGTVPRQRRRILCQRPGDPGRWRPDGVDAVCGEAGLGLVPRTLRSAPRLRRGALLSRGPSSHLRKWVGPGSAEHRFRAAPRPGHVEKSRDFKKFISTQFRLLAARLRPKFHGNFPPSQTEGAGKTGCALHPRSRVRFALR